MADQGDDAGASRFRREVGRRASSFLRAVGALLSSYDRAKRAAQREARSDAAEACDHVIGELDSLAAALRQLRRSLSARPLRALPPPVDDADVPERTSEPEDVGARASSIS